MGISKGKMGALTTMALMLGGLDEVDGFRYGSKEKRKDKDIDLRPKNPPIPKGCNQYFFNKNGGYNTVKDGYTIFICIASNYKSAKKKFDKWYTSNSQAVV